MFSRGVFYIFLAFLLSFINSILVDKSIDELNEAAKLRREKNRNNTTPSEF